METAAVGKHARLKKSFPKNAQCRDRYSRTQGRGPNKKGCQKENGKSLQACRNSILLGRKCHVNDVYFVLFEITTKIKKFQQFSASVSPPPSCSATPPPTAFCPPRGARYKRSTETEPSRRVYALRHSATGTKFFIPLLWTIMYYIDNNS